MSADGGIRVGDCPTCAAHVKHHGDALAYTAGRVAVFMYGDDSDESFKKIILVYLSMFHNLYKHMSPVDSEDVSFPDLFGLSSGSIVETHNASYCAGFNCAVHNPSVHSLSGAPLSWSNLLSRFERECTHGIKHPDFDDMLLTYELRGEAATVSLAAHANCDGCCAP